MERQLDVRLIHVHDTAQNWTANNPVLKAGEIGNETDTDRLKIGDGVQAWNDLDYMVRPATNEDAGLVKPGEYMTVSSDGTLDIQADTVPTADSHKLVESGGVEEALSSKVPTSRKINNKSLNADIVLDAADVGALSDVSGGETGQYLRKTENGHSWQNGPDLSPYIKSDDLGIYLEDYATQSWVEEKGYLTAVPTGYVTSIQLADVLWNYVTTTALQGYGFITADALNGYATETWVQGLGYMMQVEGALGQFIGFDDTGNPVAKDIEPSDIGAIPLPETGNTGQFLRKTNEGVAWQDGTDLSNYPTREEVTDEIELAILGAIQAAY